MKVSVIIPVLNEANDLGACIEAIQLGTRKPEEIIVADGGSSDNTVEVALARKATVISNPKRTAASGRNIAASRASGDLLIFTDGDCRPERDWVEQIVRVFEENDIDILAGRVVACSPENRYEQFWNLLAWSVLMEFGTDRRGIESRDIRHTVVTANCAYRKTVFDELGGFDEWFGNNAEDVDLCWRALQAHKTILYDPSPTVYARGETSLQGIRKKSFRNGVSSSKLQKRYGGILNYDPLIYSMLIKNLRGKSDSQWPDLERNELAWHLLGKYAGSIRHFVINV